MNNLTWCKCATIDLERIIILAKLYRYFIYPTMVFAAVVIVSGAVYFVVAGIIGLIGSFIYPESSWQALGRQAEKSA